MDSDAIDSLINVIFTPILTLGGQLLFDRNYPVPIFLTLETKIVDWLKLQETKSIH